MPTIAYQRQRSGSFSIRATFIDSLKVVAKKQVLTSYKIREVIDVFLKKKNELLIGLATEAFGNTDGPEFQLLKVESL